MSTTTIFVVVCGSVIAFTLGLLFVEFLRFQQRRNRRKKNRRKNEDR